MMSNKGNAPIHEYEEYELKEYKHILKDANKNIPKI